MELHEVQRAVSMMTFAQESKTGGGPESLEAVFAYGSLMSWTGIVRDGAVLELLGSQLATLQGTTRGFGKWSSNNHRWTMNLSRRPAQASRMTEDGVHGLL